MVLLWARVECVLLSETTSIPESVIIDHWDDLNRIAASLKDGLIRPSIFISKLQVMQQQNPLQQALQEVGRIAKTLHILEYVDDPAFRRRVLVGLNKGEYFAVTLAIEREKSHNEGSSIGIMSGGSV